MNFLVRELSKLYAEAFLETPSVENMIASLLKKIRHNIGILVSI